VLFRSLHLPPQFRFSTSGTSPQSLFDQTRLAAIRAGLPLQAQPLFDRVIVAFRTGLADTLHDLFLYSAMIVAIALVASLFMREVAIRTSSLPAVSEMRAEEQPAAG